MPQSLKGFLSPTNLAQSTFTKLQSACRKDVERAFDILQAWFVIVWEPAHSWNEGTLAKLMKTSMIFYIMIVKDEKALQVGTWHCAGGSLQVS